MGPLTSIGYTCKKLIKAYTGTKYHKTDRTCHMAFICWDYWYPTPSKSHCISPEVWARDIEVTVSDSTRLIGYKDINPQNALQMTCFIDVLFCTQVTSCVLVMVWPNKRWRTFWVLTMRSWRTPTCTISPRMSLYSECHHSHGKGCITNWRHTFAPTPVEGEDWLACKTKSN